VKGDYQLQLQLAGREELPKDAAGLLLPLSPSTVDQPQAKRPAGSWSLEAGIVIWLRPGRCGSLRVTAGRLRAGGRALGAGDSILVWRGQTLSVSPLHTDRPAFFSWDYCGSQPARLAVLRQVASRAFGLLAKALRSRTTYP
jgi:hypothetical protein